MVIWKTKLSILMDISESMMKGNKLKISIFKVSLIEKLIAFLHVLTHTVVNVMDATMRYVCNAA